MCTAGAACWHKGCSEAGAACRSHMLAVTLMNIQTEGWLPAPWDSPNTFTGSLVAHMPLLSFPV